MKTRFSEQDVIKFSEFCKQELALSIATIRDEYFYASIPLCVIDAVFSISANYNSTIRVVERVCHYFGIPQLDRERNINLQSQFTVSKLLQAYDQMGIERMTSEVYQNRQRTSTTNGILKSESVFRFCMVLHNFGVNNFGDFFKILDNEVFADSIRQIPGQTSGISLRYFFMLAGDDSYIKPDRMIDRFIETAIDKNLNINDSQDLILKSMYLLKKEFPQITPRLLDNLIWSYQREKSFDFSKAKRGAVNPLPPEKSEIRIRLDTDIVDWFINQTEKKGGGNYQDKMNLVLRQYMKYYKKKQIG